MIIGNESITGNVSGNIIKMNHIEPEMSQRYQEYVNSKDENEDEDDITDAGSYLRLKEIEEMMNTSPSKKKIQSRDKSSSIKKKTKIYK